MRPLSLRSGLLVVIVGFIFLAVFVSELFHKSGIMPKKFGAKYSWENAMAAGLSSVNFFVFLMYV